MIILKYITKFKGAIMEWIKFTLLYIKQRISVFWLVALIIISLIIYKVTHIKPELLAIIVSPLFTLSILAILEEHKVKWNSKYETFKILYANRGNLVNYEIVKYLNIIDIVFIDDIKVRKCWKNLYEELRQVHPSFKDQNSKIIELLNAMAVSLGLNKNIEYSDISNVYYPNGLLNFDELQENKNKLEIKYYENGSHFFEANVRSLFNDNDKE